MEDRRVIELERELVETRNAAVVLLLHVLHRLIPAGQNLDAVAADLDAAADNAPDAAEARIARMAAACLRSDWRP